MTGNPATPAKPMGGRGTWNPKPVISSHPQTRHRDRAPVGARRDSQLHALTPTADAGLSADNADGIDAILSAAAPVTSLPPKGCNRPCRGPP
jgi:hypothetical protein